MVTVVDNVGTDGTDRLRNIELLQFADGTSAPGNNPPTGAPAITGLNPTLPQEGELLTATRGTIQDSDGPVTPVLSFQWQQRPAAGTVFTNIATATGASFTPAQAQVGQVLRVVASFTDAGGSLEMVTSAPTGVVGDLFVGTAANDLFNGTAGRDNASGIGGNDTLNTGAGDDVAIGGAGDDAINTAGGNDSIRFNTAGGFDTVNGGAGTDEIRALVVNAVIGLHVADRRRNHHVRGISRRDDRRFRCGQHAQLQRGDAHRHHRHQRRGRCRHLTGSAAADRIEGGDGGDTLNGGAGADDLRGDGGADTINGGAANDTISRAMLVPTPSTAAPATTRSTAAATTTTSPVGPATTP